MISFNAQHLYIHVKYVCVMCSRIISCTVIVDDDVLLYVLIFFVVCLFYVVCFVCLFFLFFC